MTSFVDSTGSAGTGSAELEQVLDELLRAGAGDHRPRRYLLAISETHAGDTIILRDVPMPATAERVWRLANASA